MKGPILILLLIGAAFLIVLGILFYGIVFPLWMLIHCVGSKTLSRGSRILWVILIFISGPIGAFLYGGFISGKGAVQWVSRIGFIFLLCLVFSIVPLGVYFSKVTSVNIVETEKKLDSVDMLEISREERANVREALETLREELRKSGWFALERKQVIASLLELLTVSLKDNRFSRLEYNEWIANYRSRNTLNLDTLKNRVRELQRSG